MGPGKGILGHGAGHGGAVENGHWAGAGSPCDLGALVGIWPWSLGMAQGGEEVASLGAVRDRGLGQGQERGRRQGCPWRPRRYGYQFWQNPCIWRATRTHGHRRGRLIRRCLEARLTESMFSVSDGFTTTLWRVTVTVASTPEVTPQVTPQVTHEVTREVARVVDPGPRGRA